jgi:transcriptional regulator with XRE-family HTH domain
MTREQRLASGKRLKQARLDLGMTQGDLAKVTGFHENSISKWEKGHVSPRPHHMQIVAETTGRPTQWLWAGDTLGQNGHEMSRPLTLNELIGLLEGLTVTVTFRL